MKIGDFHLRIAELVPGAKYGGVASTREEYEGGAVRWLRANERTRDEAADLPAIVRGG